MVDNPNASMWLDDVYALVSEGNVDEAIKILYEHVDKQLISKDFNACNNLLMTIDVSRLDSNLLVVLLSITFSAKDELHNRRDLINRIESRLKVLAPDRFERLLANRR